MNVVITGYTGFIGRNLVDRFKDHNLFLIGRDHSLINKIGSFDPDYIFHFGAEIYDNSKMIDSNIMFTYKLLEATKNLNYKSFVNCGSSSEYGRKSSPMREVDFLDPTTLYESTKGASTLLCQSYARMYDKPIVTVRPFSVYGRYEKDHRYIPTLFRRFDNKGEVILYNGTHDFIHIDDFIEGVVLIATSSKDKILGDIVNLGTGFQYTNREVFDIFTKIYGYSIKITESKDSMRTFDTNNWVADISKAKIKYGFQIKYNFYQGLKQCYEERYNK
jgi:nucleoside-diphosphate-sugar epimerase